MSYEDSNKPTEAAVVAHHAVKGAGPQQVGASDIYTVVDGSGDLHTFDIVEQMAKHATAPARSKGTTKLEDEASFVELVKDLDNGHTRIYGSTGSFVAVFNDALESRPGWADHRAHLTLQTTPEWEHWMARDGQMLPQESFAEHIEDGSLEIREPAAAEMLELAQSFHAHNTVSFRQASVLPSGERKFLYEETLDAAAGTRGDIIIPAEFLLAIAPFEGSEPYAVKARLRYRLRESKLTLGYKLERPDAILRDAFTSVGQSIQHQTEVTVLAGHPPIGA